jgi:predicted MFS family arabinose efflux permease
MTVFAGATALGGLANTYPLMLAARFLAGLAAAFAGPQVWAAIPLLFPKDQVVKEMGYVTAGLAVAQIIGVPLGSFLAAVSWRFPFFFVGTIALLLTILSARYLPSLNADTDQAPTAVYSQVWHNRPVVKLLFAYFLFQMANFCGFAFIGTWFAKSYSLAISLIGSLMLVIGIGQFIGSLLSSRLVHWLTLPKAFALEFLLFIAGYIVLPIAPSAWLATLILAFIYLIGGAIFPLFMSTLQEQAGETRGTIASLANAAMYLGEAISGGIGGFLIANFTGFYGIAWFTAAGALVAALLYGAQGYFRTVEN